MALLQFDDYEIDIEQRRLTEAGQPLRLGGRAFDILSALVSRAGEVVTKEELIQLVWPTTTVDEGSLRVHLVALRKTLGERAKQYIETIPGRGYVFLADVRPTIRDDNIGTCDGHSAIELLHTPPRIPRRLIGRSDFIRSTLELLDTVRLMTIVGPGGIGKTSVAVACAHQLATEKRVVFIDLAAIADGEGDKLLPSLATQLGLNNFGEEILPGLFAELAKVETVLVFDSCERIVDAAATAAEVLLRGSSTVRILATSREPLRASMERVRYLAPLAFPTEGQEIDDPVTYPAIELFALLSSLAGSNMDLNEPETLDRAADIVRRLDGIPLAIELAAARSFDMDLPTLHRSVADPIALLRRGRRTAPPRQHTLRATLDWSFTTLSDAEKELLLRLSVFAGTFSPEAALALAATNTSDEEFHEAFDGLFLKSLVVVTQQGGTFRLLGTTRDYARQKLAETDYARASAHAHALYCRKRLIDASREWAKMDASLWRAHNSDLVFELRAALVWAFGDDGDEEIAIELAAASNTLWVQFGLIAEQLKVSEKALRLFKGRGGTDRNVEMKLRMSYGSALYHTMSFERNVEVLSEFHRVLEIAEETGNFTKLMRAVVGISAIKTSNGDYQDAIDLVQRFRKEFDVAAPQARSRLLNHNFHYVGDFDSAMEHATVALSASSDRQLLPPNSGSSYDPRIGALCTVVKTHWIQGRYRAARTTLAETLAEASARNHTISTCLFLAASGCPTAFGMGDFGLGAQLLATLLEISTKNSLVRWTEWGLLYKEVLWARETRDRQLFAETVNRAKGAPFENCIILAGELAGLPTLDRIAPVGNWCGAELLRLKGELVVGTAPVHGRALIREGMVLAQRQAAPAFALRCAISLARHAPPDQRADARVLLSDALLSVDQDDSVRDVIDAKALLRL